MYYVYIILDPTNSQPLYVGKGKGNRMYDHARHRTSKKQTNMQLAEHLTYIIDELNIDVTYLVPCINMTEPQAYAAEEFLVDYFGRRNNNTGSLYNKKRGGHSGAQEDIVYQEHSKKLRKKNLGRDVEQYTLDGLKVAEYPSAKRAYEQTGINASYIGTVCSGKRLSAGGYLWCYKGEPKPEYNHPTKRRVDQYDTDGVFIQTFDTVTSAAESVGLRRSSIIDVCKQKTKSHKTAGGYVWCYSGEQPNLNIDHEKKIRARAIIQYDLQNKLIKKFPTIKAAAESVNVCPTSIVASCKRGLCIAGYKWQYDGEYYITDYQ